MKRNIAHVANLEFTVVATVYENSVDFTIYDIVGWGEGKTRGVHDKPLWPRANCFSDNVDDLAESEPYLHGNVKWDGCSNWYFDRQDTEMLHGCDRDDIKRFGDVMTFCWDWAMELLGQSWEK